MFNNGDYVIKAGSGICRIHDTAKLDLFDDGNIRLYYIVIPIEDKGSKLYVPVDNCANNLRHVVDEEQALEIIRSIPSIKPLEFENEKQREAKYKEALKSCEPGTLIAILKSMYARRMMRLEQGKKSFAIDEHFFKLAQNNLYSELAFALGKEKNQMEALITDILESEEF